jgi:anti-sigma factor RsiW
MCDQRERLLSYVYDEGDAAERALVQQHLDQCPDCRTEIAGLRSVRSDLLAWEVPAHEPVWRPFAAAPPVPWWRQVPAWALATAAAVVLLLGATGSVVAQAMMPERTLARDTTPVGIVTPTVTPAELSAAQTRLAALEQQLGQVGARVERISTQSQSDRVSLASMPAVDGSHDALLQEIAWLKSESRAQIEIIKLMKQSLDEMKASTNETHALYDRKISNLSSIVVNASAK